MRYRFQTGLGTLIQLIVMSLLSLINTFINIISTCHSSSSDCVSNAIPTLILFIMTVFWFVGVAALGFLVQKKRSRRLNIFLLGTEGITFLVSGYFNLPRASGIIAKTTSLIDAIISLWVIFMALNIFLYKKRRIVKGSRPNIPRIRK